jgi:hypothetical protein
MELELIYIEVKLIQAFLGLYEGMEFICKLVKVEKGGNTRFR